MRRFSILILILLFSLPPLQAKQGTFKPLFVPPPAEQITKEGKNRQAIFVSKGGFVFVSKERRSHQDPQLYFRNLTNGKERRITHQRGQIAGGAFHEKKGTLFYSSSTDEEKESPFILKNFLGRFPSSVESDALFQVDFSPQEIYQSEIDGSEVRRLTHYAGYDGFPAYLEKEDRLYFSRWHAGQMKLFAKSLSQNLAPWTVTKTSGHDLGLQLSPQQNQFVWFRFSPDFKTSQVLLSGLNFKDAQYLTLDTGVNWSPTWHPSGKSVLYSARSSTSKNFDLYEVSVDGQCKRQITSYPGDEFFPAVSPDGETLLFTSTQSGSEQIYKLSYPGPLSCSE